MNNKLSLQQWIAIILPLILILFMWTAFVNLTQLFGLTNGYFISFAIYWILWCLIIPVIILRGFGPLVNLFKSVDPRFGNKPDITLFLLTWPIVLVIFFSFLPHLKDITFPIVLLSIAFGINGIAEEIFWRGLYISIFPENRFLNYIYPSIFFALWHICPLSVMTSRYSGGIISFIVISLLLGLSWGYYTIKTGSIRWSSIMHSVFDILGLGGILYSSWFLK